MTTNVISLDAVWHERPMMRAPPTIAEIYPVLEELFEGRHRPEDLHKIGIRIWLKGLKARDAAAGAFGSSPLRR